MKAVSFNIRTLWRGDGINSFMHRIGLIYEKINKERPDIIGFQEMQPHHLDVLSKLLPEYTFTGNGRCKGLTGEGVYIATRNSEFNIVASRMFWLSPTPYEVESRFPEQSIYSRVCTNVTLYHKASERFLNVYNVHLDHLGLNHTEPPSADELPEGVVLGETLGAREAQISLVLEEIRKDGEKFQASVILMGDFNSLPHENVLELCRKYPLTDVSDKLEYTFHAFGKPEKRMKIDYIFLSPDIASVATPAEVWSEEENGIYLSDHYPIVTEIGI